MLNNNPLRAAGVVQRSSRVNRRCHLCPQQRSKIIQTFPNGMAILLETAFFVLETASGYYSEAVHQEKTSC